MLPSKERQFPTQLCNWCVKYTVEKGAVRAQGKMCFFGSRVELYLLASYLWMINEAGRKNKKNLKKKRKRRENASYFSDNKTKRQYPFPQQRWLKISWFLKVKFKGQCLFIHSLSVFIWVTFSSCLNFRGIAFRLMRNIFSVWPKF